MGERGDRGLAAIAAAQHDVVHRSQALDLGLTREAIRHRIRRGTLHPVLPGVLALAHPPSSIVAAASAALLYAGDDAVISHSAAAHLWGLAPEPEEVDITVIGRKVRHRPGLRAHQVASLDIRDVRLCHGLPVTAPARTMIDFAARATGSVAERALNEARVLRLLDDRELTEALQRCPRRTGTGRLRALLDAERGPALTRSEAERRLRRLVEAGELPWPKFNEWLHGHLVDALWPEHRIVVEVDGYPVHGQRRAFESDRRRDQRLAAEGYVVIRVTGRQLREEPMAVLARLARALALAAHHPSTGHPGSP